MLELRQPDPVGPGTDPGNEEASMERFSPYLALWRPVPIGASSGSCKEGY